MRIATRFLALKPIPFYRFLQSFTLHTFPQTLNSFFLSHILCVSSIQKNLTFVSILCKISNTSIEFFPSFFVVKDLIIGAHLLQGHQ